MTPSDGLTPPCQGRSTELGGVISNLRRWNCQLEMRICSCRGLAENLSKMYKIAKAQSQQVRMENLVLLQAELQAQLDIPAEFKLSLSEVDIFSESDFHAANKQIDNLLDAFIESVGTNDVETDLSRAVIWPQPALVQPMLPHDPPPQLIAPVSEAVPMPRFALNRVNASKELDAEMGQSLRPAFAARLEAAPEFLASAEDLFYSGLDMPRDIVAC